MLSFTQILEDYKIEYKRERPGWINFKCVSCHKYPYMGYNERFRYCSCWSCGYYKLWQVIQLLTNLPPKECYKLSQELPSQHINKSNHTGKLKLPYGLGPFTEAHTNYIRYRKLSPFKVANLWECKGLGQICEPILRWRIWIPIFLYGDMKAWTSRDVTDKSTLRYYSSPKEESNISPDDLLLGYDFVQGTAIVCEGPMDAMTIGPGAIATLGLGVSPAQILLLSQIPRRIICFDNEYKAQERARKLCRDLSVLGGVTTNICLETGKDVNEASQDEIKEIRKQYLEY